MSDAAEADAAEGYESGKQNLQLKRNTHLFLKAAH